MEKKLNLEIDTTKFVNVSKEKFTFYVGGQPREVEAGEEKIMPVYVAQLGAKHLIDKVLQEEHGIKDTLRDTPLRRSLLVKILPELPDSSPDFKRLSPEDEKAEIKKELERQRRMIDELSQRVPRETDDKDKRIADLEEKLTKLVELLEVKSKKKVANKE